MGSDRRDLTTASRWPPRGPAPFLGLSCLLLAIFAVAGARMARGQEPTPFAWREAPPLEAPAKAIAAAARAIGLPVSKAMGTGPKAGPKAGSEAGVVILRRDTTVRFDATGRRSESEHTIYRVVSAEGMADWATVSAEWSPWFENRPTIRARVIDNDDRELRLDPATLQSLPIADPDPATGGRGDPARVGDARVLVGTIPAITVGAVVETLVERTEHRPFFAAGTARRHYLVSTAPMAEVSLRLESPAALPLRYRLHGAGIRAAEAIVPHEEVMDGRRVVLLRSVDMPAATTVEPNQPSERARWPSVTYATATSWNDVARAYEDLVDEALTGETQPGDAPPTSVAALMRKLPPNDGLSVSHRIGDLLSVLRAHTRPRGLPLGLPVGRTPSGRTPPGPATPGRVLGQGFGEGKDLATLMVTMLRREGIPAFVALLHAGTGRDIEPELPGLGLFNHALVLVPGLHPLWIDPMDPYTRAGELPHTAQDRWALIAASSTEGLVKTPTTSARDNRQAELREVYLPPHGLGRVVEVTDFYGTFERQQRNLLANSTFADRRQHYARYIETTYVGAALGMVEELGNGQALDGPALDGRAGQRAGQGPVTLRLEALATGRVATELDQAVVGIPLADFVAGMPDDFFVTDHPPRTHAYVHLPFVKEWHYRIHPPSGFTPRALPPSDTLDLGAASLSRSFRVEDGAMLADFRFDSGPRNKTAAQFDATRRALVRLTREEPVLLLWFDSDGARLLGAGQTLEALQAFASIAVAPAAVAPAAVAADHVRLGRALLSLGLVAAARTAAERALAAEPESSLAHWFHGLIFVHDALGRRWQPGADRARALAALERAVALDPNLELAQAELLLVLERDDDGRRLGPGVDLARAARQIHAFRARFANSRADSNLADILLRTQDGEALLTLAEDLEIDAERAVWGLVGTALVDGADAVGDRVDSLDADPATRVSYLSQAAQQLVLVGRYASAAALLRLAVPDSVTNDGDTHDTDSTAGLIAYAKALATTLPLNQIEEPADAARRLLHRLLRLIRGDAVALASIFHHRLLTDARQDGSIDAIASRARDRFTAGLPNRSLPDEVVLDLAYRFITLERHGGQGDLERLTVRASVPASPTAPSGGQTILVAPDSDAPDSDRLRIIGFGNDLGNVGLMVKRFLEDGEVAAAQQLLDWMVEALAAPAAGPGTDPFIGHPLPRVWPGEGPPTPTRMRDAAAVLMALAEDGDLIAEAVATLSSTVARLTPTDAGWPALANSLYRAQLARNDSAARGTLTARMLEAFPQSTLAFERRVGWLLTIGAYTEAQALASGHLHALPKDQLARRLLAQVAMARGDTATANRWFAELAVDAPENAAAFNQQAWLRLFAPVRPESEQGPDALEIAIHALELSGYRIGSQSNSWANSWASPILHTLATAYAANDQPSEAYRTLIQAVEARGGTIDPEDFLVLGRIAASVGQIDSARRYFQRVDPTPQSVAFSARALADQWLAALDGS